MLAQIQNDAPLFDAFRTLTGPITTSEFAEIKTSVADFNDTGSDDDIFKAYRKMDKDGRISPDEFAFIKKAIAAGIANDDEIGIIQSDSRDITDSAIESLKQSEGFRLQAYPDPGSRDGNPWTIGYGATGAGIRSGVKWTKEQADKRLVRDIRRFEDQVERILKDTPTNSDQFDALVHFSYNIGTGAFARSTLFKKHRRQDYAGAAREFHRWNKNDGRVLKGLVARRKVEGEYVSWKGSLKHLDLFRAIPRPLGQYLAVGLVWPLWFLLGLIETVWGGSGEVIQDHIMRGMQSIPEAGWAVIGATIIAGHWSRSKDKETKERAVMKLAEMSDPTHIDASDYKE